MSFDWRKYLEIAESLSNQNIEEGYRAAISRAYYAIYNILRIRAGYNNRQPEASHQTFIASLKNPPSEIYLKFPFEDIEDLVLIGNELDYLRLERNKADYDGLNPIRQSDCANVVSKVKYIFEMLDEAEDQL